MTVGFMTELRSCHTMGARIPYAELLQYYGASTYCSILYLPASGLSHDESLTSLLTLMMIAQSNMLIQLQMVKTVAATAGVGFLLYGVRRFLGPCQGLLGT